jgi:hypothetical protein
VPGGHQITAHVFAGAHQIPRRLPRDAGHRHRDDLAQVRRPGQMAGIAHVGFDPVTGGAPRLRGGRDLAVDALAGQEPGQPEPGRARLIGDADRPGQSPESSR